MEYIDALILFNQVAQDIEPKEKIVTWFRTLGENEQREALTTLGNLALQAHPQADDAALAIEWAGVNPRDTVCVLLAKDFGRTSLNRLVRLPKVHYGTLLLALLGMLAIADRRRRSEPEEVNCDRHWWHADLRDPAVLGNIRKDYRSGILGTRSVRG